MKKAGSKSRTAISRKSRLDKPTVAQLTLLVMAFGIVGLLSGCAQTQRPIWEPVQPPLVFPPPPDVPRIEYLGQLAATTDLHPSTPFWEKLNEALTGRNRNHRLVAPKDVAVIGDKVFVADPDQLGVLVFDMGSRKTALVTHPSLRYPAHLALDSARLFVSDAVAKSILVFTHDGIYITTWGLGEVTRPAGLCWCPMNRRLYVADAAGHCVVIFDDSGRILRRFGKRGIAGGEFNFPTAVRFDPALGLLICDSLNARIQRFDAEGKFISAFGAKGDAAGCLSLPKALAVDRDRHLYVLDTHFENIQIFDATGQLLLSFGQEGTKPAQFSLPEGITLDEQDRIWVADTFNRRLQVFQYRVQKELSQ